MNEDFPTLQHGLPITIALMWPSSMKNGERLVHTYIDSPLHSVVGDTFQARDDDRPQHQRSDHGLTWLVGHVPFDSPEARELICREECVNRIGAEQSNVFTIDSVIAAVARELKFKPEDLGIAQLTRIELPNLVLTSNVYRVKSRDLNAKFSALVHRDKASAEDYYRKVIEQWLVSGVFFKEMEPSRELFDAVVGACNLEDLRHCLTAFARNEWVISSSPSGKGLSPPASIDVIRSEQSRKIATQMLNPSEAVLKLQRDDLAYATAMILEQCSFDTADMLDAIVKSQGGWEGFTIGMVAMTDEGFIIEAANKHTFDYMVNLYDAQE